MSKETGATSAEPPISAYSASDALAWAEGNPLALAPHDEDEAEELIEAAPELGATEPAGGSTEPPAEEEEQDADVPEDETNTDEESEEDAGGEVSQLDPLIEELAKGNPQAERRVKEIAQGLDKLKTESRELKAELEKARPKLATWDQYEQAFSAPDTASRTLEQLVLAVAQHHGKSPADMLPNLAPGRQTPAAPEGFLPEHDEFGRRREPWERLGYSSEREMALEKQIQEMRQMMHGFQQDRQALAREREEAKKQAEYKEFVDQAAPRAIRHLEKTENGWKVTRTMVEKALKDFPQLAGDPARAVKAAFPDELKSHYARTAASTRAKRGPEMLPQSTTREAELPTPRRFTAADALAMIE